MTFLQIFIDFLLIFPLHLSFEYVFLWLPYVVSHLVVSSQQNLSFLWCHFFLEWFFQLLFVSLLELWDECICLVCQCGIQLASITHISRIHCWFLRLSQCLTFFSKTTICYGLLLALISIGLHQCTPYVFLSLFSAFYCFYFGGLSFFAGFTYAFFLSLSNVSNATEFKYSLIWIRLSLRCSPLVATILTYNLRMDDNGIKIGLVG